MKRILLMIVVLGAGLAFYLKPGFTKENTFQDQNTTDITLSEQGKCRCLPDQECWPKKEEWQALSEKLTGKLVKPSYDMNICRKDATSKACQIALKKLKNPFEISANPGDTQSQGWLGAWLSEPSEYAVEAKNAQDIIAAVNFAREHNLRIVIKGTGHDYLGRSTAPNSLLIWTHKMRDTEYNKQFVPTGCDKNIAPQGALIVGAGTRWLEAYDAATNKNDVYVQGGGCTTVGAAGGFIQGGGYGSFSKKYGSGTSSILEAEIVTADGKLLVANQCQNQDLFWAIRGGGGGTFGVVTKMTIKTHTLPKTLGVIMGKIKANSDEAFKKLIAVFVKFYPDNLNNQHWGEQIAFKPDNSIDLLLMYQNLKESEAVDTFKPIQQFVDKNQDDYSIELKSMPIKSNKFWDMDYMQKHYPELVSQNKAKDANPGEYWWTPNQAEANKLWFTYQSWWIPLKLFDADQQSTLSDAIYNASRLTKVTFHINKGLAGASKEAIEEGKKTALNPKTFDAAALLIMGAGTNNKLIGVKGMEPDEDMAQEKVANISKAINLFRHIAPDSGTYSSEADYFMNNWQDVFWGKHYQRLLKIKQQYDPKGLFYCHHCIGSEFWSDDGMCRLPG